ncbi:MAG: histidinol-phosphatase HisJ family protein [Lachnospiraceae bacterium]|nr:histidinol-phosphatase HisJ family protein [Lachnospiraceae bacterium]
MFFSDYHIHTNFSSDCQIPMEDMVKQAINLNLSEIAITDHVDFDYPDLDFPFVLDYDEYVKSIEMLKEKYKSKINIITGIEMGLQPHEKKRIDTFLSDNYFDFVIGSTHCVNKQAVYEDSFFEGKEKNEAYMEYFEDVLNSVKMFDTFCVYGHIDYINRYGHYKDKTMDILKYMDIIEEILKVLISKGKGIEINSSGIRYGLGYVNPKIEVLKRYKELGGEIITIGSDSHKLLHMANNFKEAYEAFQEAGFEYLTVFRGKTPEFIKI